MFFKSFFQIFYLNEENVRALRYPLFGLLGYALRRLWNPEPQLSVIMKKTNFIILNIYDRIEAY